MKELSDKDFDQIFKNRIKDGYLEFEEESWLKMEKKLRSKDRYVFLRNAGIILLFLSFGIGMYVISGEALEINQIKNTKNSKKNENTEEAKINTLKKNDEILVQTSKKNKPFFLKNKKTSNLVSESSMLAVKQEFTSTSPISSENKIIPIDSPIAIAKNQNSKTDVIIKTSESITSSLKQKRGLALSLHIGPDFNSTENTIGGKRGIAVGVGVSVPLTRKLSVQTGINYGSKNYQAHGYDYTFNNPNVVSLISAIDASCKVLEVPLRASYTVIDNQKSSIDLSAGLSSYFMLKENYRFIYTPASGRKDRFLEEKNANQHYLSVIDLSATYNIKLKNKKFALGVQPYVKIPISGIGEGNVPLKSSGIALKLNYELIKKK